MASPPVSKANGDGWDGWLCNLKKLDVYRTVPRDLTEQTAAGAAVSLIGGVLVLLLFLSEVVAFLRVDVRHETIIEQPGVTIPFPSRGLRNILGGSAAAPEDDGLLQLNFNVTLPRMPCALLSVSVQDVLGGHVDMRSQNFKRFRTDHSGNILRYSNPPYHPLGEAGGATPQYLAQEGCSVEGHVRVPRVPGILILGANQHEQSMARYKSQQTAGAPDPPALNASHIINSFFFGEEQSLLLGSEVAQAAVMPLNGATKWALPLSHEEEQAADAHSYGAAGHHGGHGHGGQGGNTERSYEYFIKVIPTLYQRLSGRPIPSFQFVSNSNEVVGRFRVPSVLFRFDIEPITIRFTAHRQAFSHFLVSCCAIIGGVIAVLGIVNMALKAVLRKVNKSGGVAAMGGGGGSTNNFQAR